ncbi:hypothetical protein [Actinokineospora diospyrosa]|uniref:Secreted protein n=1 Tax=Actinokineospora diospyrosa TaxID=103728 RepID=A0ABT1I9R1_9PSEU|nr:hypothetical protein [Actinokineospora diospyrosa]MCP2269364.1 hypothetical protein [Actinokineospora diospyrosa]
MKRMGIITGLVVVAMSTMAPTASAAWEWVGPFSQQSTCEQTREEFLEYHPAKLCEYRLLPGGPGGTSGWYFRAWYA